MGYYKRKQDWWLDSLSLRKDYTDYLPFIFLITTLGYILFSFFTSFWFRGSLINIIKYYSFFMIHTIIAILIPIWIYRFSKRDKFAALSIIKVYSTALLFLSLFSMVQGASFSSHFRFHISMVVRPLIHIIFIVLCTNRVAMRDMLHSNIKYFERIIYSTVFISNVYMYVHEKIRVYLYYQEHSGFAWTSDGSKSYLIFIALITPLLVFNLFMKSSDKVYKRISTIYSLVVFLLILIAETIGYILSLRRFFGEVRPFEFLQYIGGLQVFGFWGVVLVIAIYKIIYWKEKNTEELFIEKNNNKEGEQNEIY